jgi:hypothetical protein
LRDYRCANRKDYGAKEGADEKFKKCANAKRFESYELWSFSSKRLHKPKHRDGVAARQVRPQTYKYWMLQFAVMHFKIPDFGNQHGLHPFGFITWWAYRRADNAMHEVKQNLVGYAFYVECYCLMRYGIALHLEDTPGWE